MFYYVLFQLSPGHPFSSFVVNTGKISGLRVKELKSPGGYSQEIKLTASPAEVPNSSPQKTDNEEVASSQPLLVKVCLHMLYHVLVFCLLQYKYAISFLHCSYQVKVIMKWMPAVM